MVNANEQDNANRNYGPWRYWNQHGGCWEGLIGLLAVVLFIGLRWLAVTYWN
jgi:hypothetical protein